MLGLSDCNWVRKGVNLLITGPCGTGKSWIACAFAHKACLEGFQTLGVERDPHTVMPEAFYEVASTAAENIEIARMRVAPEILLDLQRQGVHPAPHVGHAGRQPDTNAARNRWGGRPLPAASISAKVAVS